MANNTPTFSRENIIKNSGANAKNISSSYNSNNAQVITPINQTPQVSNPTYSKNNILSRANGGNTLVNQNKINELSNRTQSTTNRSNYLNANKAYTDYNSWFEKEYGNENYRTKQADYYAGNKKYQEDLAKLNSLKKSRDDAAASYQIIDKKDFISGKEGQAKLDVYDLKVNEQNNFLSTVAKSIEDINTKYQNAIASAKDQNEYNQLIAQYQSEYNLANQKYQLALDDYNKAAKDYNDYNMLLGDSGYTDEVRKQIEEYNSKTGLQRFADGAKALGNKIWSDSGVAVSTTFTKIADELSDKYYAGRIANEAVWQYASRIGHGYNSKDGDYSFEITRGEFDRIPKEWKEKLAKQGINNASDFNKRYEQDILAYKQSVLNDESVDIDGFNDVLDSNFAYSEKANKQFADAEYFMNDFGKFMYELAPSAAGMITDAAINNMIPGAGLVNMGLRVYGSSYSDAINQGANEESANKYALMHAAVEIVSEKIFGAGITSKVYGKMNLSNAIIEPINEAITKIPNKGFSKLLLWLNSGVEEGLEEVFAEVLDPVCDELLKDKSFKQAFDLNLNDMAVGKFGNLGKNKTESDYLRAFLGGAIISLISNGGAQIVGKSGIIKNQEINNQLKVIDNMYDESVLNAQAKENIKNKKLYDKFIKEVNTQINKGIPQDVAEAIARDKFNLESNPINNDDVILNYNEEVSRLGVERANEEISAYEEERLNKDRKFTTESNKSFDDRIAETMKFNREQGNAMQEQFRIRYSDRVTFSKLNDMEIGDWVVDVDGSKAYKVVALYENGDIILENQKAADDKGVKQLVTVLGPKNGVPGELNDVMLSTLLKGSGEIMNEMEYARSQFGKDNYYDVSADANLVTLIDENAMEENNGENQTDETSEVYDTEGSGIDRTVHGNDRRETELQNSGQERNGESNTERAEQSESSGKEKLYNGKFKITEEVDENNKKQLRVELKNEDLGLKAHFIFRTLLDVNKVFKESNPIRKFANAFNGIIDVFVTDRFFLAEIGKDKSTHIGITYCNGKDFSIIFSKKGVDSKFVYSGEKLYGVNLFAHELTHAIENLSRTDPKKFLENVLDKELLDKIITEFKKRDAKYDERYFYSEILSVLCSQNNVDSIDAIEARNKILNSEEFANMVAAGVKNVVVFKHSNANIDDLIKAVFDVYKESNRILNIAYKKQINKAAKELKESLPETVEIAETAIEEPVDDLSNEVDSEGNRLSKKVAEFFKDSKARDKDGNLLVLYHGSKNKHYSVDFSKMDDGRSFFMSSSPFVGGSYAGYVHDIRSLFDSDSSNNDRYYKVNNKLNNMLESLRNEINKYSDVIERNSNGKPSIFDSDYTLDSENIFPVFGEYDSIYEPTSFSNIIISINNTLDYESDNGPLFSQADSRYKDFQYYYEHINEYDDELKTLIKNGYKIISEYAKTDTDNDINLKAIYDNGTFPSQRGTVLPLYANLENPLIIDAHKNHWKTLNVGKEIFNKKIDENKALKLLDELRDHLPLRDFETIDDGESITISFREYGRYHGGNRSEVTIHGDTYFDVLKDLIDNFQDDLSTRNVSAIAEAFGYDGVIINDVIDIGVYDYEEDLGTSTVVISYKSNQTKDIKNTNPTFDERFDRFNFAETPKVEYSDEVDSDGNRLPKDVKDYFKDSKVRDENGNLLMLYHGSQSLHYSADFSKFDDGRSFFLTSNEFVAQSYAGQSARIRSIKDNPELSDIDKLKVNKSLGEINNIVKSFNKKFKFADKYLNDLFMALEIKLNSSFENDKKYNSIVSSVEFEALASMLDDLNDYSEFILNKKNGEYVDEETAEDIYYEISDIISNANSLYERKAIGTKYLIKDVLLNKYSGTITPMYANIVNPYVVDAKGKSWREISVPIKDNRLLSKDYYAACVTIENEFSRDNPGMKSAVTQITTASGDVVIMLDAFDENNNFVRSMQLSSGKTVEEALDKIINYKNELTTNTRGIAYIAEATGHDGVIIKNVQDWGGKTFNSHKNDLSTVVVTFASNQNKDVKNTSPTFDERFDLFAENQEYDNDYKDEGYWNEDEIIDTENRNEQNIRNEHQSEYRSNADGLNNEQFYNQANETDKKSTTNVDYNLGDSAKIFKYKVRAFSKFKFDSLNEFYNTIGDDLKKQIINGKRLSGTAKTDRDALQKILEIQYSFDNIANGNGTFKELYDIYNGVDKGERTKFLYSDYIFDQLSRMVDAENRLNESPEDGTARANYKYEALKTIDMISAEFKNLNTAYNRLSEANQCAIKYGKQYKGVPSLYLRMQISAGNVFRALGGFKKFENNVGYELQKRHDAANRMYIKTNVELERFFDEIKKRDPKEFQEFATNKMMSGVTVKGSNGKKELSMLEALDLYNAFKTMGAINNNDESKFIYSDRLKAIDKLFFEDIDSSIGEEKGAMIFFDNDKNNPKKDYFESLFFQLKNAIDNSEIASEYNKASRNMLDWVKPLLEETALRSDGYEKYMFDDGTYYPLNIRSDNSDITKGWVLTDDIAQGLSSTRIMQERGKLGNGYVSIRSMSKTIDSYMNQAANYIAYNEFGKELQYLKRDMPNSRNIIQIMTNNYGENAGKWMNEYINSMDILHEKQDTDALNSIDKLLGKSIARFQQGALFGSLSVPIKQVSSYWAASGVLSPESLLKARPQRFLSKIDGSKADMLADRIQGGLSREMYEWVQNKDYKNSKLYRVVNGATAYMDTRTVNNLYKACIYEIAKTYPQLTSDTEIQNLIDSKFEEVVLYTQPQYIPRAKAEYARTKSAIVRAISLFRTQQTQNFNRIITASQEYLANKDTEHEKSLEKELRNTIQGQIASYVSFGALQILADIALHRLGKYDDDDDGEIDADAVAYRLLVNSIESGFATLWFADDVSKIGIDLANRVIKGIKGEDYETSEFYSANFGVISNFMSLIDGAVNFMKYPTLSNAKRELGYISNATGYSINNAVNMFNALAMWSLEASGENIADYDDIFKYFRDQKNPDSISTSQQNHLGKKILNLIEQGNYDEAENIKEYIQRRYDDNDGATQYLRNIISSMYISGDLSDEQLLTYSNSELLGFTEKEYKEFKDNLDIRKEFGMTVDKARQDFIDGKLTEETYRKILETQYKGSTLDKQNDIDEKIKTAKFEIDNGFNYNNLSDLYEKDKISAAQVVKARMEMAGETEEEAMEYVYKQDFKKTYGVPYDQMDDLYLTTKNLTHEEAVAWRMLAGSSQSSAESWVTDKDIRSETGYISTSTGSSTYYSSYKQNAKMGSNEFYMTYGNRFNNQKDFGDIFNKLNNASDYANGISIDNGYGGTASATQTGVVNILRDAISSGKIDVDLAKSIWTDYYGYSDKTLVWRSVITN